MTKSSLRAAIERLGQIQDVDRVRSGSPVVVMMRLAGKKADVKPVSAALALAKRGPSLLPAKRAVEEILERGELAMLLHSVEDPAALARELRAAGIRTTRISDAPVDVRLTRERLGMTQDRFALRFGFDPKAVRYWEQGIRTPNQAAAAYLRVIERMPQEAGQAQEEEP